MFRCLLAAWICIEIGKLPALPLVVALAFEIVGMILAAMAMAMAARSLWRQIQRRWRTYEG